MASGVSSRWWQVSEVFLEYLGAWFGSRKLACICWSGAWHIWIVHRWRNWWWYGWYSGLVVSRFRCFSLNIWVYIIMPQWWPTLRSWWVLVDGGKIFLINFCYAIDASSIAWSGCKIEDIIWDRSLGRSLVHSFGILRHRRRRPGLHRWLLWLGNRIDIHFVTSILLNFGTIGFVERVILASVRL